MSKESFDGGDVFDLGRLRKIVEFLREFDLNEIDLRDSAKRIRITRGGVPMATAVPAAPLVSAGPSSAPASASSPSAAKADDDKNVSYIKSPMVGSFYSRPKPDQPSFVKVGDVVAPDTIVCMVEAMKMFNEIPAGLAGKIVEVCVKDGEAVDVNKPLFKVAV